MDYEVMMNGNVRVGQMAPDFEAITTFGNVKLSDYRGKWLVLFSHPGDFTPVCTTELIAFAKSYTYFKNINTELLGLSIDSNSSHLAWVYDIYCKTGVKIPFPIIADRSGEIARKYGMISNNLNNTQTVRNVYIIDPNGIIKIILIYPLNIGRFIPEILRSVIALQTAENNQASTPANWIPCNPILNPMPITAIEQEEILRGLEQNKNGINWYLTFKKAENCKNLQNNSKKEICDKSNMDKEKEEL